MTRINRLVEIIEKDKEISKVQLVIKSQISISYFDKLRPFLLELYSHKVIYDAGKKKFVSLDPKVVTQ